MNRLMRYWVLCPKVLGFIFPFMASVVDAHDWPYWRGPEQTGMVREKAVVTSWSQQGENVLWQVPIGGRSTPIVMNGRVFLITPVGEGLGLRERVICLDADTGKTIWEYAFNVFDTDVVENRVGWTSLTGDVETGNVYAHGTGGELICFDRDGKLLWKRSLREEFGRISGYGGRLLNPMIDEDRVIVGFTAAGWGDHAKPLMRYGVFDKRTGAVVMWAGPGGPPQDTTYSTTVTAVIDGWKALIAGNADGVLYGMKARTGETLWSYRLSKLALNTTPVVDGKFVYATHGEENPKGTLMGAVACIDASKRGDITESGEVWRADGIEVGYASPAIGNGRVYAVDNSANLYCLDGKTGKEHWRFNLGRVGKGSPVVTSDGVIYVGEQTGVFHILKDAGDHCDVLDREEFKRPDEALVEIFGSPAVANGRVYFETRYATYCLGRKDAPVLKEPIPPVAKEQEGTPGVATTLQVVPAEISVVPGEKVQFTARLLDANTRVVTGDKVEWSLAGVKGQLDSNGLYTAPGESAFTAGQVVAKSGALEAKARLRVGPKIPFREDFEGMAEDSTPPGWTGVVRKTKIVTHDGSKALQKLAEDASAPFMRVKGYMTSPVAGGYTMTADMLGTPKGERFRPDMGLINSRYELTLMGTNNVLRLESWTPVPRLRHDVPFEWSTDRWYRMRFEVRMDGEKAHLRGKVWPRDSTEPGQWTIEFVDPFANREGSPGLYAYSPGTTPKSKGPEVFFDNIEVRPNE